MVRVWDLHCVDKRISNNLLLTSGSNANILF